MGWVKHYLGQNGMARKMRKSSLLLSEIPGVGEVLAGKIAGSLGVKTVADFIESAQKNELQSIAGVGQKKEKKLLAAARSFQKKQPKKERGNHNAKGEVFDHLFDDVEIPREGKKDVQIGLSSDKKNRVQSDSKSIANKWRCPICLSPTLSNKKETLKCDSCKRDFPIIHGVPDLALSSTSEKRALAQKVMETDFYSQHYETFMRPKLTRFLTKRKMEDEYCLSAQLLDLRESSGVLDVACGTGNYTRYFAKVVECKIPITGVDLSWPMLEMARRYVEEDEDLENIFFVRADATQLPFRDSCFDRVHCSGALYLIPDVDAALAEFYRVSEPGALLVVGAFTQSSNPLFRLLKNLSARMIQLRFFDEEELISRIEKAGFRVINEDCEGDAITIKALRKH